MIFVTTTKKFNNVFRNIQKNALNSWNRLEIDKKIVVLSEDEETIDFCNQSNFFVIRDFEKSPNTNIPTFRSLHHAGILLAKDEESICLINGDIVLDDSFVKTYQSFKNHFSNQEKYLLVGQRIDANFNNKLIEFNDIDWKKGLTEITLHPGCGIDYFLMSKTTFKNLPDFYVSRTQYDGWLITEANSDPETLLVDCTKTITAYHQNHDYGEDGTTQHHVWINRQDIKEDLQRNKNYPHGMNIENIKIKTELLDNQVKFKNVG